MVRRATTTKRNLPPTTSRQDTPRVLELMTQVSDLLLVQGDICHMAVPFMLEVLLRGTVPQLKAVKFKLAAFHGGGERDS